MKLNSLVTDDDAVSPVIGVILMVAVTVILAAVIGAFVLGIGSQVTETTPSVTLEFDYNGTTDFTISHEGGDTVENDQLSVNVEGTTVSATQNSGSWNPTGSEFTAGESITIDETAITISSNDGVLLIYETDGGSTAILGESEVP